MIRHICPPTSRWVAVPAISVVVAVVSTFTQPAFAQSPPQQPASAEPVPATAPKIRLSAEPAPRKIVFDAAPASTGVNRGYHYHDGFYLRAGLNYGPGWGGLTLGEEDQTQIDYSGGLLDFNLLIAGTPSPGFSVGGGLLLGSFIQPDMETDGDDVATSNVGYLLLGPFVDGYFAPNGGGTWVRLLAWPGSEKRPTPTAPEGLGAAFWVGYDAWVGADWALGGNVRFTAAAASGTKPTDFLGFGISHLSGFQYFTTESPLRASAAYKARSSRRVAIVPSSNRA